MGKHYTRESYDAHTISIVTPQMLCRKEKQSYARYTLVKRLSCRKHEQEAMQAHNCCIEGNTLAPPLLVV